MLHERLTKDEGERNYGRAAINGGLHGGLFGAGAGALMTGKTLPGR